MKKICIRMDEALYSSFKIAVIEDNSSVQTKMTEMVSKYVNDLRVKKTKKVTNDGK